MPRDIADPKFLYHCPVELTSRRHCSVSTERRNDSATVRLKLGCYSNSDRFPRSPSSSRIVAILDEAFDGIATAKANAEKNLQNARALFESHLQSVFTERGEGWVEKRSSDVTSIVEWLFAIQEWRLSPKW